MAAEWPSRGGQTEKVDTLCQLRGPQSQLLQLLLTTDDLNHYSALAAGWRDLVADVGMVMECSG